MSLTGDRPIDQPPAADPTQHQELVRTALAGVGTSVWQWDLDTDLLSDTDAVLALLGYAAGEIGPTQADWDTLIHPDDLQANHEAYLRHARGELETYEHTYRALAHDGRWHWFHERGRIVERHPDGRPRRVLGTQTDISERRAAEEAAAVAEAANRAKTEFLSRVSHELRTPLNAVLGFTQLMEADLTDPPSETQRRRLALVRESGEHLLQMIGDLLDLTRIESGGLALQLQPTPLQPLAQECAAMLQAAALQVGVTVAVHVSAEVPAEGLAARADPTRLRQVLLNLLGNAIKYNRPGGRADLLLARGAAGEVQLLIVDTGVGIEAEHLGRVFEPFYRGLQQHSRIDGAGIGLSVTQALVQLMGGRIGVTSRPGAGSTFTVTLPAA